MCAVCVQDRFRDSRMENFTKTIIDRFMRRFIDPRVNPIFGVARMCRGFPSMGHRKDTGEAGGGKKLLRELNFRLSARCHYKPEFIRSIYK